MDWKHILTFLGGLVAGYTIKFALDVTVNRTSSKIDTSASKGGVSQTGNRSKGPIVGGDYAKRDVNKDSGNRRGN